MLIHDPELPCVAISYDSATFNDLQVFLLHFHNIKLDRVEPDVLFNQPSHHCKYINLVVRDLDARKIINQFLDNQQLQRFTFIHPTSVVDGAVIGKGVIIYPLTMIYPGAIIGDDVIINCTSTCGHNSKVSTGTFTSSRIMIAGSVTVGEYCRLGTCTIIHDNITICNNVQTGAGAIVRNSITEPGTYITKNNLERLY